MKKMIEETNYSIQIDGTVTNEKTGKVIKPCDNGIGYKYVKIKGRNHYVHRLVAFAFLPNPQNLNEINHIDEDKSNNHIDNLEWCTHAYNVRYSCCKAVRELRARA